MYAAIKNQRTEQEDNLKTIERQTKILMKDIKAFRDKVFNAGESDLSPSVLKDFLDQLAYMKTSTRVVHRCVFANQENTNLHKDKTRYMKDG